LILLDCSTQENGFLQAVKSLAFQIFFWLFTIPLGLAMLPSLILPRAAVHLGLVCWVELTLWSLRVFTNVRFEVRGTENLPGAPCLIASKHQSMWETMAFNVILKDPAIVIKRELTRIPFYGWYIQKMGSIVIDRDAHASALKRMIAAAKDRFAHGRHIIIFPEGTRKNPGDAPDYKPGTAALYAHLNVPCVPVALNSGHFWPRSGWRRRPGVIVVEFLPRIEPGLKRQAFMDLLESRIETAMAQPQLRAPLENRQS
jgi:1-acyl-sn-glycerol-3-phosphate acyltransferase